MINQFAALNAFFLPRSMAIIGASEALNSFGTRYIQALLDFGYKGRLYAVNHAGTEVLGFKIYRSVLDIPEAVDLAAVCVGARFVPATLRECVKKGIKAAIVLSAGFSEAGDEGRLLEEELVGIVKQGICIMGPNCFGTYCPSGTTTIIPGGGFPKEGGGVALIAQSGQLSEGIIGHSFGKGIRFSKVASYGNACDVNEADLMEYLMQDEETRVFTSYLEGVRDGRRFFEIARRNAGRKPVVLWKVGLTRMGGAAAVSHTGSLAGAREVWDAFFRQTHAIQVDSLEDLTDTTIGFECLPSGCGRRIALLSGGGAGAVIGADACERAGLQMVSMGPEAEMKLRAILPAAGTSIRNPIDVGTPHPPLAVLSSVLEAMAVSDRVDVIVIRRIFFSIRVSKFFSGSAAPSFEEQQALLEIPVNIRNKFGKPVVIILPEDLTGVRDIGVEEERREIRDYYFKKGIPVYSSEPRGFSALANLAKFRDRIDKPAGKSEDAAVHPTAKKESTLTRVIKTTATTILDEVQSKEILKEAGADVIETALAKSREEALAISERLGFPVAMKIVSPQITHKSDLGGVKLGLKTASQVGEAFEDIMHAIREKAPEATVDGISVQRMSPPGVELVIGVTKDPQFGPVMMFGLGGIFVEILKDVAFRIVPLTREDSREMIRQLKAFPLLKGYRGRLPVDIAYLEELLLKISGFIVNHPEIQEMDINPIIASSEGAVVVDARIILEG